MFAVTSAVFRLRLKFPWQCLVALSWKMKLPLLPAQMQAARLASVLTVSAAGALLAEGCCSPARQAAFG